MTLPCMLVPEVFLGEVICAKAVVATKEKATKRFRYALYLLT